MTGGVQNRGMGIGPIMLGGSLIIVGVFFLIAQLFNFDFLLISVLWPLFIIVPGVLLFSMALTRRDEEGKSLATVGSIVSMLGLLLFYQNSTGHWENWAYAWALLVPTAVGIGQMIFGTLTGQSELVKGGSRLAVIGSVIFLVGFFFFEVILGIGGMGLARYGLTRFAWPILLIGVGMLVIVYNLFGRGDDVASGD